jgi:CitMHS family citrate-Mg2+:H+ or citrate-Ca2+:H+ symporter
MLVITTIILLAALLILILHGKFLPGNIMAILPLAAALIIGTGFENTMLLAHEGIQEVSVIVVIFIFATIYFGVMSDAGLFEPLINRLMSFKWIGKSVFSVVATAALIAMAAHLDGQGITTLIVTVPPMLIVFDKLKINRLLLGLIFATLIGAMDMLPWAGQVTRAAAVINVDVMEIYRKMLPVQIAGIVLSFIVLYIASKREEKRGAFVPVSGVSFGKLEASEAALALRRPALFWANAVITILLLAAIFIGVPPHIGFLIGCAIVLPLNYRTVKEQEKRVKSYAGNIIAASYTFIGAGVLLGIMEGVGMFEALAGAIVSVIPASLANVAHIMFGFLIAPLSYLLNSDGMIYGIMPVLVDIGARYGVAPVTIVSMFISGRSMAIGLSVTTPSVYLGLAMMGITYKDAFKMGFKYSIILGTILMLLSALIVR